MCTNESTSTAGAAQLDVAALLLAAPGLEVMAALTALDLEALSEPDRLVVLEVWERQQHWVWAQTMTATLAFAGKQPVDSDDFVREDVRAELRLSRPGAQDRIDTARLLATTLTDTHVALAGGLVSPGHVRRLVEEVRYLDPAIAVAVQDRVLAKAPQQTVSEFGRAVKKAILVVDPRTAEQQHALAVQARTVEMYPEPDAMAHDQHGAARSPSGHDHGSAERDRPGGEGSGPRSGTVHDGPAPSRCPVHPVRRRTFGCFAAQAARATLRCSGRDRPAHLARPGRAPRGTSRLRTHPRLHRPDARRRRDLATPGR